MELIKIIDDQEYLFYKVVQKTSYRITELYGDPVKKIKNKLVCLINLGCLPQEEGELIPTPFNFSENHYVWDTRWEVLCIQPFQVSKDFWVENCKDPKIDDCRFKELECGECIIGSREIKKSKIILTCTLEEIRRN